MASQTRQPESVSNPHDAYAKSVFREVAQARAFFRAYLPDEVQALFDWRTLRLVPESFVSDELQRDFADQRYTVRLAGDQVARRITLLFEHKYRPLYRTARQLHRYISRQMEETPDNEALPSILTFVLLQSGTWNRSPTLSSEYDLPDAARQILAPYLVDFRMVVVELKPLGESDLKGTAAGRLALAVLKAVGEDEPMRWSQCWTILRDVCRKLSPEALHRELRRAVYYVMSVMKPGQEAEVRRAIQSIHDEFLPVKEHIMTLLEHLEKRGEKRGKKRGKELGEKRGRHQGQVKTLVQQLSAAFPEFTPADADQVRKLPVGALDQLTNAIALRRSWTEIESVIGRQTD